MQQPANMMTNPRIYRGSNWARPAPAPIPEEPAKTVKRKAPAAPQRNRPATPPPVQGRQHIDIQTEQYLEEITDRVPEEDMATQTDVFLDRPATPLFVPKKSGVDAETQIENGELFDFDREVEPLLEIIVGRTLEQSLAEVLREEELRNLKERQRDFEHKKKVELAEIRKLEETERLKYEEQVRRLQQEKARLAAEKKRRMRAASQTIARDYVGNLVLNVFDQLVETGHIYDRLQRGIADTVIPSLYDRVDVHLGQAQQAQRIADEMIFAALMTISMEKRQADRMQAVEAAQREADAAISALKDQVTRAEEEARRLADEQDNGESHDSENDDDASDSGSQHEGEDDGDHDDAPGDDED